MGYRLLNKEFNYIYTRTKGYLEGYYETYLGVLRIALAIYYKKLNFEFMIEPFLNLG